MLECLRLAVQVPTASNDENWRWIVVADPDLRRELAEIDSSGVVSYLANLAATESDRQTRRVAVSAVRLTNILARVPVLVIPCIEGRFDGAPNAIAASAYGSIMPAAWSFLLALRSRDSVRCGPCSTYPVSRTPRLPRVSCRHPSDSPDGHL